MKLQIVFCAILVLLNISFISTAKAQYGIGGGCFEQNQICDETEYQKLIPLSATTLVRILHDNFPSRLQNIIGLKDFFIKQLLEKKWYLTAQIFELKHCPFLYFCQNLYEVRVQQDYWKKLTKTRKFNLIVYEALKSHALKNNLTDLWIQRLEQDLQRTDLNIFQIRNNLYLDGLSYFPTLDEERDLFARLSDLNKAICPKLEFTINQSYLEPSQGFYQSELYIDKVSSLMKKSAKREEICSSYEDTFYYVFLQIWNDTPAPVGLLRL